MLKDLCDFIKGYLDDENLTITEETLLYDELDLSSFEYIQLISSIEDKYDIEIKTNELINIRTIKDIEKIILTKS